MAKAVTRYALRTINNGCTASGYFNKTFDSLDMLSHEIRRFITEDALTHRYKNKQVDHLEYITYIRKYFQNTKIVKLQSQKVPNGLSQRNQSEKIRQSIIETMVDYYLVVMAVETLDSDMSRCGSTTYASSWSNVSDKTVMFDLIVENYKENKTFSSAERQYFLSLRNPYLFSHREKLSEQLVEIRYFLHQNKIKNKKFTSSRIPELYWLKNQSDLNYAKLFYNQSHRIVMGDLTKFYTALESMNLNETRHARLMEFIHNNHYNQTHFDEEVWLEIDGVRLIPYQKLLFLP